MPLLPGRIIRLLVSSLRWLLGYDGVGLLARPTFRYELLSNTFAAFAGGLLMSEFMQLFALKSLSSPSWLMAILVAEMGVGNLFGALLAQHLQRRRRIPWMVKARLGSAATLGAIALLPASPWSLGPLVGILLAAAVLAAVILNVQSSIWHSNYGEAQRGKIYARISVVRLATMILAVKLSGYALDSYPTLAHHAIFAVGAAAMVVSAMLYSRIRVRREKALLREAHAQPIRLWGSLHVLRDDKAYAHYMLWQMVSGGALLMTAPVVVPALQGSFGLSYSSGTTVLVMVPFLLQLVLVPLAGHLFDKVSISTYRFINATLWATSRFLLYMAVLLVCWPLLIVAYMIQGAAQASGDVVWNIGHTRFAPPGQGQLYMGVHMTLQGVRGLTLPFVGMLLYHIPHVGVHVLAVTVALQLLAGFEFLRIKPPTMHQAGRSTALPVDVATIE